jgi:ABC-type transport system involved in multi-copper enzyme maturation permease subunit
LARKTTPEAQCLLSCLCDRYDEKELRVSSRRKRNYALRSAYLLLLTVLIASAWLSTAFTGSGTIAYTISRMGELGKNLILTITWFQFFAAQLVAVVMLSNSISDEIRRGTLDVLMTTPVNSFQIVAGKLLSSLLQLTLLLAISLPLLAILRVLGGMHWDYVVASLSITFTAVLFAGSLTMLLSVKVRRPYFVILVMLILLILAHSLASVTLLLLAPTNNIITQVLVLANPAAAHAASHLLHFSGRGCCRNVVLLGPSLPYYGLCLNARPARIGPYDKTQRVGTALPHSR